MNELQKKAIMLLGKKEMNAKELCDELNIAPNIHHKPTNGEYYVSFKENVGLQITDDAEIDDLIKEERSYNNIPNNDIFSLTKKGLEKYQQIIKDIEERENNKNGKISAISAAIACVVAIVALIYMIMCNK